MCTRGNHGDFLGIKNCFKLKDVKDTILKVQYVQIGDLSNSFSKQIRGSIFHQSNCELLRTVAAASLLAQLAVQVVVQTGSSGTSGVLVFTLFRNFGTGLIGTS